MDRGYSSLCFILIVAASAQSGLAQSPGSLTIQNNAAGTMTRQMFITLSNGVKNNDPAPVPFPQGTQYVHQLLPNEYYIYCSLRLVVPSGKQEWSDPIVWTGSKFWSLLNCMPNCYIVIDNRGFWQASSAGAPLEYYWGWSWGSETDSEGKMEMLGQH